MESIDAIIKDGAEIVPYVHSVYRYTVRINGAIFLNQLTAQKQS